MVDQEYDALDSCCDTWGEFITQGDGLNVDPESTAYYFDSSTQQWKLVLADHRLKP